MSSKYYYDKRDKQEKLLGTDTFGYDNGGGEFMNHKYSYVLTDGNKNIFPPILDEVKKYFEENNISWWSGDTPTGHILSSQMACVNHLFLIRKDKDAVLRMLNGVRNEFTEVLPIECDKDRQYIAFEVVSSADRLGEINCTRGANCTSVDAFIMAKHKSGQTWLIPIEWKFTEHYGTDDKSAGKEGLTRIDRYNKLIRKSDQLKWFDDYKIYYQEPFYQLMRQTLWAEQVIKHKDEEVLKADDYFHIHIIPKDNGALLKTNPRHPYKISGMSMESTWRSCLRDNSKYKIVDPEELLKPIASDFPTLIKYLRKRYW